MALKSPKSLLLLSAVACSVLVPENCFAQSAKPSMPPTSSIEGNRVEPSDQSKPSQSGKANSTINSELFSPPITRKIPNRIPKNLQLNRNSVDLKTIKISPGVLKPLAGIKVAMPPRDKLSESPVNVSTPFVPLKITQNIDDVTAHQTSVISFELTSDNQLTVTDGWVVNTPKWKDKFATGDLIAVIQRNNKPLDFVVFHDPRIAIASFDQNSIGSSGKMLGHNVISEDVGFITLSFGSPSLFKGASFEIFEIPFSFSRSRRLDDFGLSSLLSAAKLVAKIDGDTVVKILTNTQR